MPGLEIEILNRLHSIRACLVTAESCTGGLVASRLCRIPGASNSFWGGIVCYDNSAKATLLGVPEAVIQKHGAVSEETARALAEGALSRMLEALRKGTAGIRATRGLAVATTGIAGPSGGTPLKPVGLCYIAVADSAGAPRIKRVQAQSGSSREECQDRFVEAALELLLQATTT